MNVKLLVLLALLLVGAGFIFWPTQDVSGISGDFSRVLEDNPDKVSVYFFWGEGCPHCAYQKPFLERLQNKYSEIEVKMFETWENPENVKLFSEMAKAYGTTPRGVPTTFIGEKVWVGYVDYMNEEMENEIKSCIANGCINPGDKLR